MAKKTKGRDAPVADLVDHEGENENAEGERPESNAEYVTLLRLTKIELSLPLADDLSANDKAKGAGHERDETAPEEAGVTGGIRVHVGIARCARRNSRWQEGLFKRGVWRKKVRCAGDAPRVLTTILRAMVTDVTGPRVSHRCGHAYELLRNKIDGTRIAKNENLRGSRASPLAKRTEIFWFFRGKTGLFANRDLSDWRVDAGHRTAPVGPRVTAYRN